MAPFLSRQEQSLDQYLQEVGRIGLLTPDEEAELARRIKGGDQEALDQLTRANLRFVVSVAKKYRGQGLSLADLIEEGNYGLMQAAQAFDEMRGFKFISYAVWWIRHAILGALAEHSRVVRLPVSSLRTITKIRKTSARLTQLLQRTPKLDELADELELGVEKVHEAMQHAGRSMSLDAPFTGVEDNGLLDRLPGAKPDVGLRVESVKLEIERALRWLTPREAEVIRLYFGLGCERSQRLGEIGQRLGLSCEGVRRIKEKALCRLRDQYLYVNELLE